jgi:hypothetical protein
MATAEEAARAYTNKTSLATAYQKVGLQAGGSPRRLLPPAGQARIAQPAAACSWRRAPLCAACL